MSNEAGSSSNPEIKSNVGIHEPGHSPWKKRVTLSALIVALVAAAVVIPPLVNIGRYQRQVTALMSTAMGRPVHLSGIGLRLLPRPGFVLHDLTVSEDPKFGAEPILFARSVVASVGIVPLWQGKLQVTRVSVDEASLNLVRTDRGRWNLDSLMMQAQPSLTTSQQRPPSQMARHFPYLEATNSRVNFMRGAEKSPFSLVGTDLSLWQDQPGEWRVRLRGQPVRTDVELIWADTGQVRLEGSLHAAPTLRDMPFNLQAEWRDAQLGQLSRLVLGSDAGWRGDLSANIDVQGTADNAQTKARLRATGVRRQEFTPEIAMDLDTNCTLRYQHSLEAVHDLGCDTSIGNGKLRLKGDLPGSGGEPQARLEVQQVPLQAALDLLRTVRGGLAPGISARGEINGDLQYATASKPAPAPVATAAKHGKTDSPPPRDLNLKGSLVVSNGILRGGKLKDALALPTITFQPVLIADTSSSSAIASPDRSGKPVRGTNPALPSLLRLETQFTLPLGPAAATAPAAKAKPIKSAPGAASSPASSLSAPSSSIPSHPDASKSNPETSSPDLDNASENKAVPGTSVNGSTVTPAEPLPPQSASVKLTLGASGYRAAASGAASVTALRDLVYAFGLPRSEAIDDLTAGNSDFDVASEGPWIPSSELLPQPSDGEEANNIAPPDLQQGMQTDVLSGAIHLHRGEWKAAYLDQPVHLSQGIVAVTANAIRVSSDFEYGAAQGILRGSLVARIDPHCKAANCEPRVEAHFGALDASVVQAALLGAPRQKSILSPLVDRVRVSDRPKWPALSVNMTADSLLLGKVMMLEPSALVRFEGDALDLQNWEAKTLGGAAHGTGRCSWADAKPAYTFDGVFSGLNATAVAASLGTRWKDGELRGSGHVKMAGLNQKELAATSAGVVHFQWSNGTLVTSSAQPLHFSDWTGDAEIRSGRAEIGKNTIHVGDHSSAVAGAIPFGGPARLTVSMSQDVPVQAAQSRSGPSDKPLH